MGHRATVGACSLAKFGYRPGGAGLKTPVVIGVDRLLLARLLLTLMVKCLAAVLIQIPGCILDKLRHVLQINFLVLLRCCFFQMIWFHSYFTVI